MLQRNNKRKDGDRRPDCCGSVLSVILQTERLPVHFRSGHAWAAGQDPG